MVCYSSCTDSLFYEQSTNLVKSVRRPIGHTTTTTATTTTGELQANAPLGTTSGEHQASYPITAWAKNNKLYFGREQFFRRIYAYSCMFSAFPPNFVVGCIFVGTVGGGGIVHIGHMLKRENCAQQSTCSTCARGNQLFPVNNKYNQ